MGFRIYCRSAASSAILVWWSNCLVFITLLRLCYVRHYSQGRFNTNGTNGDYVMLTHVRTNRCVIWISSPADTKNPCEIVRFSYYIKDIDKWLFHFFNCHMQMQLSYFAYSNNKLLSEFHICSHPWPIFIVDAIFAVIFDCRDNSIFSEMKNKPI